MPYSNQKTTSCQSAVVDYPGEQNVSRPNSIKQLDELEIGRAGLIVSIKMKSDETLRELTSMGISPYAIVRMFANQKSHFIFMVDSKKFAADREIAAGIMVQPI
ncbi:MAG: ferrous iron transport protein A [Anaerolineales bacterium]|nr:ferrous iron transport protein A [Anaerolineales bacterium]